MAKRKKIASHGRSRPPAALTDPGSVAASSTLRKQVNYQRWLTGVAILLFCGLTLAFVLGGRQINSSAPATTSTEHGAAGSRHGAVHYVGAKSCAACHAKEVEAWQGSHHQLAMQETNASTVLGDFKDAKFRYHGVESTFFKRDGRYFVRTDGPDGKLADFEIKFTFGVTPLQQYLIPFPGGRNQTLSIAWDTRPKEAGGQRWFHLYPLEKIDHKHQLHWTGIYQNWNMQCAECHSTNLTKGYDAQSNAYRTTFSEINVSCEACHGPGSRHVEWAKQAKPPYSSQGDKGLLAILKTRWDEAWKFPDAHAKYAVRDQAADPAAMNTCAACHARRSTITRNGRPGAALEDSHRLALLTAPNYHADGQQRDEVYTWGSFLQSKMFQKGVTCLDCHEPHQLGLRAQGNALCVRCHNAAVFDAPRHHFHRLGGKGAQCVACHMPTQNYMVVDARRDHSMRVPRPDHTQSLGSPNACTQCHTDRKPEWAAAAMDRWYGIAWRDRPHFGTTLHAGATQGVKAVPALIDLAKNPANPALVRATAATLVQPYMHPGLLPAARLLLLDGDPSVRIAALGLIEPADAVDRVTAVAPRLADPVRGVRIEAARVLADVPDHQFPTEQRRAREHATQEYLAALQQDADWPASNVNLGNFYLRQGHAGEAIMAYERALSLDARFAGAYVNLAEAHSHQGLEDEAVKVLRRGLAVLPEVADLHHALGLSLVRQGDKTAALKELGVAAKLAAESAHYAYVYAVALHSAGKRDAALAVLRTAEARHPDDMDILSALISMSREVGDVAAALRYTKKADEILAGMR